MVYLFIQTSDVTHHDWAACGNSSSFLMSDNHGFMTNVCVFLVRVTYAPISVQPQGAGVGHGVEILTFCEKMSQIPPLWDDIIGQKYQKPPPWGE